MKKYKFKLEGLLKLRKFKEQRCKMEIGVLQKNIAHYKENLEREHDGIHEAAKAQGKMLEGGIGGREAQFFPRFIEGKELNMKLIKRDIQRMEYEVSQKILELNHLRGELKVIENLKEKDLKEFKYEQNKKYEQDREELNNIWSFHKKVRG